MEHSNDAPWWVVAILFALLAIGLAYDLSKYPPPMYSMCNKLGPSSMCVNGEVPPDFVQYSPP